MKVVGRTVSRTWIEVMRSCLLLKGILEILIGLFFCDPCGLAATKAVIGVVDRREGRLHLFLLLLFLVLFV